MSPYWIKVLKLNTWNHWLKKRASCGWRASCKLEKLVAIEKRLAVKKWYLSIYAICVCYIKWLWHLVNLEKCKSQRWFSGIFQEAEERQLLKLHKKFFHQVCNCLNWYFFIKHWIVFLFILFTLTYPIFVVIVVWFQTCRSKIVQNFCSPVV